MAEYSNYIDLEAIFDGYEYDGNKDSDDFQDELYNIIDEYICGEHEHYIDKLVHTYGVFKAIKDYTGEYGEFTVDPDLSFVKTYRTLAYYIIDDYIRENMSIMIDYLEENNMTEADTEFTKE